MASTGKHEWYWAYSLTVGGPTMYCRSCRFNYDEERAKAGGAYGYRDYYRISIANTP